MIDKFQSFTTPSVVNLVFELRKYLVALTLAHQNLAQLDSEVRNAVLDNVGSLIAFRIGPEDAAIFAREIDPVLTEKAPQCRMSYPAVLLLPDWPACREIPGRHAVKWVAGIR